LEHFTEDTEKGGGHREFVLVWYGEIGWRWVKTRALHGGGGGKAEFHGELGVVGGGSGGGEGRMKRDPSACEQAS
jgi:hypothetical protein